MTMSNVAFGGGVGTIRGHGFDVPTVLQEFGIGYFNIPMVTQYVFMIPRTTDPDAQGVIMLVEAVQRGLQRVGARVRVSGILDQTTVDYLRRVSGEGWHAKTWIQILGDLLDAQQRRVNFRSKKSLGEYVETDGIEISTGSVAFLVFGAYLVYRIIKR